MGDLHIFLKVRFWFLIKSDLVAVLFAQSVYKNIFHKVILVERLLILILLVEHGDLFQIITGFRFNGTL